MGTPAERSRQLDDALRGIARSQRTAADYAHSRTDSATFEDVSYWENAAAAAMERWEQADAAYLTALHQAGDYPDDDTAAHVAELLGQRDHLYREVERCSRHRDECIDRLEAAHRPLPPTW